MTNQYLRIAVADSVKAVQARLGSRQANARQENGPSVHQCLGPDEAQFIQNQDSFCIASISETGWPYIQHRGGSKGFLTVIDERTLAFPEYPGNRQYITFGNLSRNPRISLFLINYPDSTRLKIFGLAKLIEQADLPGVMRERLNPKIDRAMMITVEAYDWNCPKYIVPRFTEEAIINLIKPLNERIESLERELVSLRSPR
ncbi:MAG: pyridoxamine 5'-phosphate oxidase family protein [Verrucomicrobia bacterium]|nr:pyridoxamine 5'-phosphate oxidase family protein [Verrucomicrobiota bacterium]